MPICSSEEAIEEIKNGKMLILVDDELDEEDWDEDLEDEEDEEAKPLN